MAAFENIDIVISLHDNEVFIEMRVNVKRTHLKK